LAFAHGTGTPPMDPQALAASAQMNSGSNGNEQQPQGEEQQPPQRPQIDPNHPAAQLARAKVKAAFGKPINS